MALTDDCQVRGGPDWGAQAPTASPACADGEQTGGADWGEDAAYDPPWTPNGGLVGYPDGGAFTSYDPSFTPDSGLVGFPDWGEWASYDPDWTVEGGLVGFPDWGDDAQNEGFTLVQSDLELAARRNWIFSRFISGKVWFYSDFEATTLQWAASGTVALSTDFATSGDNSVKLTCGASVGNQASIGLRFPVPTTPKFGIGFHFNPTTLAERVIINCQIIHSGVQHDFYVTWDMSSGDIQYLDADGNMADAGTVGPIAGLAEAFNFIQIVGSYDDDALYRIIANDTLLSIAALINTDPSAGDENRVLLTIQNRNYNGTGMVVHIDDVVMTYDEAGAL